MQRGGCEVLGREITIVDGQARNIETLLGILREESEGEVAVHVGPIYICLGGCGGEEEGSILVVNLYDDGRFVRIVGC